jgi:phenylacetate-CoA ligase
LGGANMGDETVRYDALRHTFQINIYQPYEQIAQSVKKVLAKTAVPYIHGYPSTIYDFACFCRDHDSQLHEALRNCLRGVMLSSEYPAPLYRSVIEEVFDIKTVSWYGHTERAVLAGELTEPFVYEPFLSYGYAELLANTEKETHRLISTSYHNLASPLIRYDTTDEVAPIVLNDGILESFRVEAGREGDYVIDASGKNISLTGLIFGRHHTMFNHARFIQVAQDQPGTLIVYISADVEQLPSGDLATYFDLSHTDFTFDFRRIDSPILTPRGKTILNVTKLERSS